MAISSMQAVSIIGLVDNMDDVITVLGKSGVFQPDNVTDFYGDTKDFTHLQTKNIYAEPLTNLKASLNLTKRKFKVIDVSDYNPPFEELEKFAVDTSHEIDALVDDMEFVAQQLFEAKENLVETSHFVGLDVGIESLLKLKYVKATFGKMPKDSMSKLDAYKHNPFVDFNICTEDKTNYWGVYFTPFDKTDEIDKIFMGLDFQKCDVLGVQDTPKAHLEKMKLLVPELEAKVKEAEKNLNAYITKNTEEITKNLSKLEELYLYAGIRTKALQYNKSFIIVGWVPSEAVKPLKKKLSKIDSIETEFSASSKDIKKAPPVKLKNCFLARPFEFYTEMYGVPKYNEIDPTLFVALTYIVIFGIMFADLGQGLLLSLIGLLMWKIKKMKIGKILIPCGISSAVFGTIFGSVFGFEHLLDPMYKAVFGLEEKPFEVMAAENTNIIIFGAIAIGIFLLIVAMLLNVYTSIRQKNIGRALFSSSGLAGAVFYSAAVFAMLDLIFLKLNVVNLAYILGLIVFPFLLIFFSEPLSGLVNREPDWKPESWCGYIVEKLFESIEILLSYVTNTMSFLRVGAFVLVHAGMMMVVFMLAETAGGAGSVGYWIIVVIGNALVMALEALLVSIQTLRLEYYEMFSKFYSGEGRSYEPVKLITE